MRKPGSTLTNEGGKRRCAVEESKFGVKLAAAVRAQVFWREGDVNVKTESQNTMGHCAFLTTQTFQAEAVETGQRGKQ